MYVYESPSRTARAIENLPDTAPSPEDLLAERQELETLGLEERVDPKRAPMRTPEQIHEMLSLLPEPERLALINCWAGGASQMQEARRALVSQPMVRKRILRAIHRLRWVEKTWKSFGAEDLERDCADLVSPRELRMLAIYWRTLDQRKVLDVMGFGHRNDVASMLWRAAQKLPLKYRQAFESLRRDPLIMIHLSARPTSALDDFVLRRLTFSAAGRVPSSALRSAYEAHAQKQGRPFDASALFAKLRSMAVRPWPVRVDGSLRSGWAGVRLTTSLTG